MTTPEIVKETNKDDGRLKKKRRELTKIELNRQAGNHPEKRSNSDQKEWEEEEGGGDSSELGTYHAPLWTAVIYFTNEADIKDRLADGPREHADRQLDGRPQTSRQELTVTEGRQTEGQADVDT
uniref:Uncharacterized protein n=1 Tax=Haemonchus contortus TaxID=6289 RepID=A0A7I4Y368_HAECO